MKLYYYKRSRQNITIPRLCNNGLLFCALNFLSESPNFIFVVSVIINIKMENNPYIMLKSKNNYVKMKPVAKRQGDKNHDGSVKKFSSLF